MRPPRYPLEPLAKLRDSLVDAALGKLGGARRKREEAEHARSALEQNARERAEVEARARGAERQSLESGECRAADLARASAWEVRVQADARSLASQIAGARSAEADARKAEAGARGELAARQADAKVIEQDRARWDEARRKRAEAKEEEAASEAFPAPKP